MRERFDVRGWNPVIVWNANRPMLLLEGKSSITTLASYDLPMPVHTRIGQLASIRSVHSGPRLYFYRLGTNLNIPTRQLIVIHIGTLKNLKFDVRLWPIYVAKTLILVRSHASHNMVIFLAFFFYGQFLWTFLYIVSLVCAVASTTFRKINQALFHYQFEENSIVKMTSISRDD